MKISVIIPAFNEAANIVKCIRAIKSQSLKPHEILVVDNGSEDGTPEFALNEGAKVLIIPKVHIGVLRNAGAANASGDILAFIDADCVPGEDWLITSVRALAVEGVGAVGNTVLPMENGNWVEKAWHFNIKSEKSGEARYIGSANLIMLKRIFDQIHGFNPVLRAGEDRELSWKIQGLGLKTVLDEKIRVVHLGYPKTILEFFKRELWHGKSIKSDLKNLKKSRMIYVLFFLILCMIFSLIFIFINTNFSIILLFTAFLIPIAISMRICILKKSISYFIPLSFLYAVYLCARIIALIYVLYQLAKGAIGERKRSFD